MFSLLEFWHRLRRDSASGRPAPDLSPSAPPRLQDPLFLAVFSIFLAFNFFRILFLRLYPFIDLPVHLASATIFRYYGDPANRFTQFYSEHFLFKPNLFHILFCGLPVFPSAEFANHIYYGLYVLLLPLSVLAVIRRLGGNPWYALLSFMFLYNFNVLYGFTGYTIAIPLTLFLFCLMHRYACDHERPVGVALALGLALMFEVHAIAQLFAILVFLTGTVACPADWRRRLPARLLVAAPSILLLAAWWRTEKQVGNVSLARFLADYYRTDFLPTFTRRLDLFWHDHIFLYPGWGGWIAGGAISAFVLALALLFTPAQWRAVPQSWRGKKLFPLAALLISALGCYLFLPPDPPFNRILHFRFATFFWLGVILVGSVLAPRRIHPVRQALITAGVLAYCVAWNNYFAEFEEANQSFIPSLFEPARPDSQVLALIPAQGFRGRQNYVHFANYYTVWRRGIAVSSIPDFNMGILTLKKDAPPLPVQFYEGPGVTYDHRYAAVAALLVRGAIAPVYLPDFQGAQLRRRGRDWALYLRPAPSETPNTQDRRGP